MAYRFVLLKEESFWGGVGGGGGDSRGALMGLSSVMAERPCASNPATPWPLSHD